MGAVDARVVGLDIGGTKLAGSILRGGEIVATITLPTRSGPAGIVATAAEAVRALCARSGVPLHEVESVGIGVPGVVDAESGALSHVVNLDIHAEPVPLAELLSAELRGVPVALENDVNAAAIGLGAVLGEPDLALLSVGTGLAAGLLLDGAIRRGSSGAAGEIGHLVYRPDGLECACGQHGCLERYASGAALSSAWPTHGDAPAAVDLFRAAAAGSAAAIALRHEFCAALAYAVRLLALTVDVPLVFLGGGVAASVGAPLIDAIHGELAAQSRGSAFLASLALPARIRAVPPGTSNATVGAAIVGRRRR